MDGCRANPVIWGEAFFDEIKMLSGDTGARALFHTYTSAMNMIEMDEAHLSLDADTEEDVMQIRHILGSQQE